MHSEKIYPEALALAAQIEDELKRMGRWREEPLPAETFENMGAFGSQTMSFEQWIQFVLLKRIRDIVETEDEFPEESNVAAYAVRYFDGDMEVDRLHDLLYALDNLIESQSKPEKQPILPYEPAGPYRPVVTGNQLPEVTYTLIDVLPQFEGDQLESQLQTFDTILASVSAEARSEMVRLLRSAAGKTALVASRERIEKAAVSLENGGRAAPPYNHEEAMRKYREEFRKGYGK